MIFIVEVETGEENRPGAEGDVVDAEAEVRTLDAHYNSFVMGFSYNNVVDAKGNKGLKFVVKTPFGQVTEKSTPDVRTRCKARLPLDSFQISWSHDNNKNKLEEYKGRELTCLHSLIT
ncbi:MAG: hypothetical protein V8R04_12150 [Bacteroides thetaiotaomicron]